MRCRMQSNIRTRLLHHIYKQRILTYGITCPKTKLWLIPLSISTKLENSSQILAEHQINNIYHTKSQENLIQFLHQCLFSPTTSTLLKAIDNDQLLGFPGLTKEAVIKHLPLSTATIKEHQNRTRQNLRPT